MNFADKVQTSIVSQVKTLIGKDGYLFLTNDSGKELEVHCNNLNLVSDLTLARYRTLKNFLLIVFPNKSLLYKQFLPDNFNAQYRPALDIYQNVLGNKIVDTYDVLKSEPDTYYKTDSHINVKGSYMVYRYFISKLRDIFGLDICPREIMLHSKVCALSQFQYGLGDLLWSTNLGSQTVEDADNLDTFYDSNDFSYLYSKYIISNSENIRILNKTCLSDITESLEGSILSWAVLSEHLLYKRNIKENNLVAKGKVLIFYDSFLIPLMDLYLSMFEKVYMSKSVFTADIIKLINPDYVFEFRVERFLF